MCMSGSDLERVVLTRTRASRRSFRTAGDEPSSMCACSSLVRRPSYVLSSLSSVTCRWCTRRPLFGQPKGKHVCLRSATQMAQSAEG